MPHLPEIAWVIIGAAIFAVFWIARILDRIEQAVTATRTEVSLLADLLQDAPWVVSERDRLDHYLGGDE